MSNISQRLNRLDLIAAKRPSRHYRPFKGLTKEQLLKLRDVGDAAMHKLLDGVRRQGNTPSQPEYDIPLLQQRLDALNNNEVQG